MQALQSRDCVHVSGGAKSASFDFGGTLSSLPQPIDPIVAPPSLL